MNKMVLVLTSVLLAACNPSQPVEITYPMPDELKHCKVYRLNDGEKAIRVVHCPKEPTTTTYTEYCGKGCTRTITTAVENSND